MVKIKTSKTSDQLLQVYARKEALLIKNMMEKANEGNSAELVFDVNADMIKTNTSNSVDEHLTIYSGEKDMLLKNRQITKTKQEKNKKKVILAAKTKEMGSKPRGSGRLWGMWAEWLFYIFCTQTN